jgi:hypothetical protein
LAAYKCLAGPEYSYQRLYQVIASVKGLQAAETGDKEAPKAGLASAEGREGRMLPADKTAQAQMAGKTHRCRGLIEAVTISKG